MIGSIIAVVLAIPIIAIAAFVMVLNLGGRLRRLEARFAALEARLGGRLPDLRRSCRRLPSQNRKKLPQARPNQTKRRSLKRLRLFRRRHQNPSPVSKNASARNGWSGLAASRSRSAGSS